MVDNTQILLTAEMMCLADEQHNANSKVLLPCTPMEASSSLKNTVVIHTSLFV
jgi:hypothetical protein